MILYFFEGLHSTVFITSKTLSFGSLEVGWSLFFPSNLLKRLLRQITDASRPFYGLNKLELVQCDRDKAAWDHQAVTRICGENWQNIAGLTTCILAYCWCASDVRRRPLPGIPGLTCKLLSRHLARPGSEKAIKFWHFEGIASITFYRFGERVIGRVKVFALTGRLSQ